MPRRHEPESSAAKVGARIRELRIERNLSPAELATATGFSKSQVLRMESGLNLITAEMITTFAKALGVRDFDLLTFPSESELGRTAELTRKLPRRDLKKLQQTIVKAIQAAARAQLQQKLPEIGRKR